MICMASRNGVIALLNLAERPASTPRGLPTRSDSPTAANISAKGWTTTARGATSAEWCERLRRRPSAALAFARDRHQGSFLVDHADDAAVLDRADRTLAGGDHRDSLAHGRGDVQCRSVCLAGTGLAHD